MSVAVIEYTDAAKLIADARALRARLYAPAPAPIARPQNVLYRPVNLTPKPSGWDLHALMREARAEDKKRSCYHVASPFIREAAAAAVMHPRCILWRTFTHRHVLARQHAMWLTGKMTSLSLAEIGLAFGRDHTTIIHGIRAENERRGENVRGLGGLERRRARKVAASRQARAAAKEKTKASLDSWVSGKGGKRK